MSPRRTHIIVVAAGVGSRFGSAMPKQYCLLDGRPVLMHTIDRMREALPQASISLVISKQMSDYWADLCRIHSFDSPVIVFGGATRSESVRNAVLSVTDTPEIVLVHDGARPLVDKACVLRVVDAMSSDVDGAIPAVAVSDSLRELHGDVSVAVDRSCYRAVQTPQAFDFGKLYRAYRDTDISFTDDASLMEHCGHKAMVLTEGSVTNIKITNPVDLSIAQLLLHSNRQ